MSRIINEDGTINNIFPTHLLNQINDIMTEVYKMGVNYGWESALWYDKHGDDGLHLLEDEEERTDDSEEVGQTKKNAEG